MTNHPRGVRRYRITPDPTVLAVQLKPRHDWAPIARWCRGVLGTSHDGVVALSIPGAGGKAVANFWICQGVTGHFFIRSPEEFTSCYTAACICECESPPRPPTWEERIETAIRAEVALPPDTVRVIVDGVMAELSDVLERFDELTTRASADVNGCNT